MGRTFVASLSTSEKYNQETIQYFRKIDVVLPVLKESESHEIGIEVRDVPEIMAVVEHVERSRPRVNDHAWQIHRISDEGIVLYLATHNGSRGKDIKWKEGYIFIPMENVIAIHNVDQVFLDYLSKLSNQQNT